MVGGRDLVGVCQVGLESILGKHEICPAVWQVRLLVMGQSDKQLCTIPLYIHPRHCFAQQLPVRQLSYDGPLTKLGKADSLFLLDLVCAGGKHAGSSVSTGAVCFDVNLWRQHGRNFGLCQVELEYLDKHANMPCNVAGEAYHIVEDQSEKHLCRIPVILGMYFLASNSNIQLETPCHVLQHVLLFFGCAQVERLYFLLKGDALAESQGECKFAKQINRPHFLSWPKTDVNVWRRKLALADGLPGVHSWRKDLLKGDAVSCFLGRTSSRVSRANASLRSKSRVYVLSWPPTDANVLRRKLAISRWFAWYAQLEEGSPKGRCGVVFSGKDK